MDSTFKAAIEQQKRRDWSGAKLLWQQAEAHILGDLNLAICHSWSRESAQALALLDRYQSWSDLTSDLIGLSPQSVEMLRRSILAVELYTSDLEGDMDRVSRCAEELADLGGDLHELVRNPMAVVAEQGQIEVIEDVVYVGDILIPLTFHTRRLHRSASKAARQLADLYRKLKRNDFEPLTTDQMRLATNIGLPVSYGPRLFTPSEWQTGEDAYHPGDSDDSETDTQFPPNASQERIDDFWLGFHDELAFAFRSLVEQVSRPFRKESPDEYARIYYMVKQLASILPLCHAVVRAGTSLYRARVVGHARCERDISYVPDPNLVQEFGRVNAPEEAIFYCANNPRTAVAEVLNEWFQTAKVGDSREVFVGRWIATRDIKSAIVPYHEEALRLSPVRGEVRRIFGQLRNDYAPATYKLVRDCLTFLGADYARPARNALDYWISTAYFNFATNPHNFPPSIEVPEGLLYPSIQMKYHGDNFATFPHIVDSALHLIDAHAMHFRCLGVGRFTLEGHAPRWFSKRGRQFEF
jgi:hypothetical protein